MRYKIDYFVLSPSHSHFFFFSYDIRDRARLLKHLVFDESNLKAETILLASKPAPLGGGVGANRFRRGTLSDALGIQTKNYQVRFFGFLSIFQLQEGFPMEHIDMKNSLDSKLQIGSIHSIRISFRTQDNSVFVTLS